MRNFRDAAWLEQALGELLSDPDRRLAMGEAARTMELLDRVISAT